MYLPGEHDDHRLEQREAAELAGPTGLDERDAAIGQPYARHVRFEIAGMPEDVQVAVARDDGSCTGCAPATSGYGSECRQ